MESACLNQRGLAFCAPLAVLISRAEIAPRRFPGVVRLVVASNIEAEDHEAGISQRVDRAFRVRDWPADLAVGVEPRTRPNVRW